jgi:hypothetical protein
MCYEILIMAIDALSTYTGETPQGKCNTESTIVANHHHAQRNKIPAPPTIGKRISSRDLQAVIHLTFNVVFHLNHIANTILQLNSS